MRYHGTQVHSTISTILIALHTLMVNVALSYPLTRGLPGFGGSGLNVLGSMAVAIILEGTANLILLGATNFILLPSELVNIFDILE